MNHQVVALLTIIVVASSVQVYDNAISLPLNNHGNYLGVTARIGTPPQSVELLVDTGSEVSWVVIPENPHCLAPADSKTERDFVLRDNRLMDCHKTGVFVCNNSSTCSKTKENLFITYGDTTTVEGVYASDTFGFGSSDELSLRYDFGLGTNTNSSFGVFALGIPSHTVKNGKATYTHKNFAMRLKDEDIIERVLFSVWMNEEQTTGGEILFGAVDRAKYIPPLVSMKVVSDDGAHSLPRRFDVVLSDISINKFTGSKVGNHSLFNMTEEYDGELMKALPDTGSKLTYLPLSLFDSLISLFDERIPLSGSKKFAVECPVNDTVSFKFGTSSVNLPLRDFVSDRKHHHSKLSTHPKYDASKRYCVLGFMPKDGQEVVLGHAFLRRLYTVFDLDTMQISMAPAVYTNRSEVQPVTLHEHLDTVPDVPIDGAQLSGPAMLDPAQDFIADTNGSFYRHRYSSRALNLIARPSLLTVAAAVAIAMLIVL